MKKSRIALFDAYGTLFKIDTDKKDLNELLGIRKEDFLNTWRSKLLEYSWLTSLMEHWESFNSIILKALHFACKVYEIELDKIRAIMMEIYEKPTLFSDAQDGLELLHKEGFKCCIISNGEPETLKNAVQNNKIESLIDKIFSASEVQKYKVSPKVYRMATAFYNTGPSQMFFISSNAWDIAGAHSFGYKTIWVNRDNKKFDTLIDSPDFEVKSIAEIPKILS